MRKLLDFLIFVLGLYGGCALAADWQIAGMSESASKENEYAFFDSSSIIRPIKTTVRVWVSLILESTLEKHWTSQEKATLLAAGKKIAAGYRPKYFTLDSVKKRYSSDTLLSEAAIYFTGYEIIANTNGPTPTLLLYQELDCKERKIRTLQLTTYDSAGKPGTPKAGGGLVTFIPPDTNAQWLWEMVCV